MMQTFNISLPEVNAFEIFGMGLGIFLGLKFHEFITTDNDKFIPPNPREKNSS
jgi:hypothetical protein